jgi:hypothetical protein
VLRVYLVDVGSYLAGAVCLEQQLPGIQGVVPHPLCHVVPVEAKVGQDGGEVFGFETVGCLEEGPGTDTCSVPHLRCGKRFSVHGNQHAVELR